MDNKAEEKKRALLQEEQEREREEQRVTGLMQIRRQMLRMAFEAEKVRQVLHLHLEHNWQVWGVVH